MCGVNSGVPSVVTTGPVETRGPTVGRSVRPVTLWSIPSISDLSTSQVWTLFLRQPSLLSALLYDSFMIVRIDVR